MKLQAVTVCIYYADYLECILPNRRNFDRWIVMTVPDDAETIALCERHGIECRLSKTLKPDGSDFHATLYKSSILNEGLDALDPDGWALILDADVRLPRNFRERLNALSLESGVIYGAAGRRICEDREMFEMLVECEPWDRFCARYSGVIGFFQLFDLEHPRNRYLPSNAPGTGPGDDDQFQLIFPPESRRMLPMTVIHVGKSYVNWHRRVVERFDQPRANRRECGDFVGLVQGRVAVVGYFPGMGAKALFEQCERVDLVDHFQIHQPSGDPFIEADRSVLRELWAMETEELTQLHLLGPHSIRTLAMIPDGSLDALYLSGEVAPSWLVEALPHWLGKLKPGATVFGDLYGLPDWREATFTISLLLGAPDATGGDGSWWRRVQENPRLRSPLPGFDEDRAAAEQDGVVLVNAGRDSLEALLLTAHSVREHWAGPVRIYHWGEENESLLIACSRIGIGLWNVGEKSEERGYSLEACIAEVAEIQPFRRAILLRPGMLAVRSLATVFEGSAFCYNASCWGCACVSANDGGVHCVQADGRA